MKGMWCFNICDRYIRRIQDFDGFQFLVYVVYMDRLVQFKFGDIDMYFGYYVFWFGFDFEMVQVLNQFIIIFDIRRSVFEMDWYFYFYCMAFFKLQEVQVLYFIGYGVELNIFDDSLERFVVNRNFCDFEVWCIN